MKFCIVSQVVHSKKEKSIYAYGPYVREMNLWEKHIDELIIVAPLDEINPPGEIDLSYTSSKIRFVEVKVFNLVRKSEFIKTFFKLPRILFSIFHGMLRADHIHLRCPGNMGLLGALVQIFFPHKKKTAKYAGNWDWNSNQPWSYRIQQQILRNTFLTRNMQVLVYGDWKETENIKPFFTASYSENEIEDTPPRKLNSAQPIQLIFVGSLNEGKRPLLSLEVALGLFQSGIKNEIHFYGEGTQREEMEEFMKKNRMEEYAFLHGNVSADIVKKAYQRSHFLIFVSKSEGWPKVIAESMFWGCLPLTTAVSCVPEMIGNGLRGDVVVPDFKEVISRIEYYLHHHNKYEEKCEQAMKWSREFTLEKFETEIKKFFI